MPASTYIVKGPYFRKKKRRSPPMKATACSTTSFSSIIGESTWRLAIEKRTLVPTRRMTIAARPVHERNRRGSHAKRGRGSGPAAGLSLSRSDGMAAL
jgi:hypothetical protein